MPKEKIILECCICHRTREKACYTLSGLFRWTVAPDAQHFGLCSECTLTIPLTEVFEKLSRR